MSKEHTPPAPKRVELFQNDAVWAAFYRDGKNLGEIAKDFDCSIYELSPWLTAPLVHALTTPPLDRSTPSHPMKEED